MEHASIDDIQWGAIKVLVVDDDTSIRRMMEQYFKKIGCVGIFAANGEDAVELARKYKFDICFMDIFMPKMGGVAAAQAIKDTVHSPLPIIALTASTMKANKEKCLAIGMLDYIIKPVSIETIKRVIAEYGVTK